MKINYWTKEEISILEKYYPNLWIKDFYKKLSKRNRYTIAIKARNLGLPSAKLWKLEENKILKKYFAETKMKELTKLLPTRTKTAILAQGERLGLKRNRNKSICGVNENYFKKWSSNMAYILGFIITDGCIVQATRKGHSDILSFGVHIKDIDILEKIKNKLESNHKISTTKSTAYFRITNQKIVNDLKRLKIKHRKTLCENVPPLPKKYIKDFIRGAIDGDGSIYIAKNYPCINFCGGKEMVTFVQNHLLSKLNVYSKIGKRTKAKNKNRFLFSILYKGNTAKKIIHYLYNNSELYLKRKFQKAQDCLKIKIENKEYTKKEEQIIKKLYTNKTKNEILKMLPKRSWRAIQQKSRILNIYKYNIKIKL